MDTYELRCKELNKSFKHLVKQGSAIAVSLNYLQLFNSPLDKSLLTKINKEAISCKKALDDHLAVSENLQECIKDINLTIKLFKDNINLTKK